VIFATGLLSLREADAGVNVRLPARSRDARYSGQGGKVADAVLSWVLGENLQF
jgi:hypothetical protein